MVLSKLYLLQSSCCNKDEALPVDDHPLLRSRTFNCMHVPASNFRSDSGDERYVLSVQYNYMFLLNIAHRFGLVKPVKE